MRVTSAGSCETTLRRSAAVLFGSSTIEMMRAVTSGSVAIDDTLRTAFFALVLGSTIVAAGILPFLENVPAALSNRQCPHLTDKTILGPAACALRWIDSVQTPASKVRRRPGSPRESSPSRLSREILFSFQDFPEVASLAILVEKTSIPNLPQG